MDLHEELKQALELTSAHRPLLAEPSVKRTVLPLRKALAKFLQATKPYAGIDWAGYLELTNALGTTRITKTNLPEVNRRLQSLGARLKGTTAAAKQEFALEAARSGSAQAVAVELRKPPEAVMRDESYRLARASAVRPELRAMAERDLKKMLKFCGLKEQKTRRANRLVFDRSASEEALMEHLKEVRFRIGG